jgi:uncharacterized protein YaaN involved in tellurite resistance
MDKDEIFLIKKLQFLIEILERYGVKVSDFEFFNEDKPYSVVLDFSEHDKAFENKIASLEENVEYYIDSLLRTEKNCDKLYNENKKLKQRIAELESKEMETCEKEPISDDCRQSMEWYENRHQSDCIEINRLNTTIDVLIHRVEYLRQFAGLE